jgi:hypothetical protein
MPKSKKKIKKGNHDYRRRKTQMPQTPISQHSHPRKRSVMPSRLLNANNKKSAVHATPK